MEEYKSILKTIDDKLRQDEELIEYYRNETKRLMEEIVELKENNESYMRQIESLVEEIQRQASSIAKKEQEIKYLKEVQKNG